MSSEVVQDSKGKPDIIFVKKRSSEKLFQRYKRGSETASVEIHTRYENRLICLARKRLLGVLQSKMDADDIAQETFATFFAMADRNEVQWRQRGDLWRLLAGIAINKVKQQFDHYSALKRDLRSESRLINPVDAFNADAEQVKQLSELVEHVLASEKPLVETVLKLRLAGFAFEEIAEQVGRSTRTIRRLLESLKTKLITQQEFSGPCQSSHAVRLEQAEYSDFHLLRMVGQGSFAKVYLAKQVSTGDHFAIKAIKKRWLKNLAARQTFFSEAKILMSLTDPSFVKTYGIGQLPNGGCFLVLQWIDGKPLSELIGTASLEDRSAWVEQVRHAVKRLHAANIIHGDIGLNNVMIDTEGKVKILDFGLGRRVSGVSVNFQFDLNAVERLERSVLTAD